MQTCWFTIGRHLGGDPARDWSVGIVGGGTQFDYYRRPERMVGFQRTLEWDQILIPEVSKQGVLSGVVSLWMHCVLTYICG